MSQPVKMISAFQMADDLALAAEIPHTKEGVETLIRLCADAGVWRRGYSKGGRIALPYNALVARVAFLKAAPNNNSHWEQALKAAIRLGQVFREFGDVTLTIA